jgi:hypothetical protein
VSREGRGRGGLEEAAAQSGRRFWERIIGFPVLHEGPWVFRVLFMNGYIYVCAGRFKMGRPTQNFCANFSFGRCT